MCFMWGDLVHYMRCVLSTSPWHHYVVQLILTLTIRNMHKENKKKFNFMFHSFIHSLIHSFNSSFVHSFIHWKGLDRLKSAHLFYFVYISRQSKEHLVCKSEMKRLIMGYGLHSGNMWVCGRHQSSWELFLWSREWTTMWETTSI